MFLSPRPPGTAFAGFGPVPGGETAREAVRRLNDWFRLRDCPQAQKMIFADQGELFPLVRRFGCLRHEIGACLGPCAAACTRGDYAAAVRAAVRFLEGADVSPLETLERDMRTASAAEAFERAAALRDKWTGAALAERPFANGCVRRAGGRASIRRAGRDGSRDHWHLIHHGRVRAVVPAPRDDAGRTAAAAALTAVYRGGGVRAAGAGRDRRRAAGGGVVPATPGGGGKDVGTRGGVDDVRFAPSASPPCSWDTMIRRRRPYTFRGGLVHGGH